jgi:hypothetical protein
MSNTHLLPNTVVFDSNRKSYLRMVCRRTATYRLIQTCSKKDSKRVYTTVKSSRKKLSQFRLRFTNFCEFTIISRIHVM